MYASFCLSGLVDLLCHYAGAPGGTDLVRLALSRRCFPERSVVAACVSSAVHMPARHHVSSPSPPTALACHLTPQAFLGLAFLSEGVLLGFHLKGPQVEVRVHLILVLQVLATVVAILAELARPSSVLAALARPWLTLLQGAWWIQTAFIM